VSKLTGYFVGRFFPISPNAENLVVRYFGLRGPIGFLFEVLKSLNYFRGSLGIGDTETATHFEWQFNNNFSHGAETPFTVRIVTHELSAIGWAI